MLAQEVRGECQSRRGGSGRGAPPAVCQEAGYPRARDARGGGARGTVSGTAAKLFERRSSSTRLERSVSVGGSSDSRLPERTRVVESCGEVGVLEGGGREALEAELREVESCRGKGRSMMREAQRDAACPLSTTGRTRLARLVRGRGRGGLSMMVVRNPHRHLRGQWGEAGGGGGLLGAVEAG